MELKAIKYGQVQIISGIYCDAYILNDGKTVMSERATADLLGMDHAALIRVVTKGIPKTVKPFYDNTLSVVTNSVEVTAENSTHKNRNISVYSSEMIENFIFAYATAFANEKLRLNQKHIGQRCILLLKSLARTALETAIKEACGVEPKIQETAQRHFTAIEIMKEAGFISSLNDEMAIKKDIVEFLRVPDPTLNSFLRKHRSEIKPILLDVATIRSIGCNANRMHAYAMEDVAKIIFGMDSDVGIELKRKMFGDVATLSKPNTKDEIAWREFFTQIFAGFDLQFNALFGKYRLDFLIPQLEIALECNGYEHKYYDIEEESRRERLILRKYALIRFHHNVKLEVLFNAILHAKVGQAIVLYDKEHIN